MISLKVATIMMVCLIGLIVGVDIYLSLDGLKGNTWSEMLRIYGKMSIFLPLAWGVLTGHMFHPFKENTIFFFSEPTPNYFILVLLVVTMCTLQFFHVIPYFKPIIGVALGIPLGMFLWPV